MEAKEEREFYRFGVLASILIKAFGGKDTSWREIYGLKEETLEDGDDLEAVLKLMNEKGELPDDVYQKHLDELKG